MATGSWPSLLDLASRTVGGKQVFIAEMLSQSVALYDDLPMVESNEVGGHEFVFRTSIPQGFFRQYNQGTPYSKSTTAKARVGVGELVDYSQVDRTLAEDSGDIERFRENEDVAFLEGMGQTLEQTSFYGNTIATPSEFMGLSNFYNTVNTANAQNAANVISAGGVGTSNASLWLLGLGERSIYGIYPRGSKVGLAMEDKGDTVPGFDSVGNRFEAYTSWFRAQMGIVPEDWRFGARLCNIDVTAAGLAGPNAYDIFAGMAAMGYLPPTMGKKQSGITKTDAPLNSVPGVRYVWITNRTVRHWMDVQAMRDRNVLLQLPDYAGMVTDNWRQIPVRVSDQLLITEATVT
jgi:hypothetical protein